MSKSDTNAPQGGGLSCEGSTGADARADRTTEETGADRPAAPISCQHLRGFYFCKDCGKDLTPEISCADDVGSPTQYPR